MTQPYPRRAVPGEQSAPTLDGWSSQPAGRWRGRSVDIVFDPRRHDVLFHRGPMHRTLELALDDSGWRRRGTDGHGRCEWWSRDRVELARRRLRGARGKSGERSIP